MELDEEKVVKRIKTDGGNFELYNCPACSYSSKSISVLKGHTMKYHKLDLSASQQCDSSSPDSNSYANTSSPDAAIIKCPTCDAEFKQRFFLQEHSIDKHGTDLFASGLDKRAYFCSICDNAFKSKYYLKRHSDNKHGFDLSTSYLSSPQKCCDKIFYKETEYDKHLKNHNLGNVDSSNNEQLNGQLFICPECGLEFKRRYHLQRHSLHAHGSDFTMTDTSCQEVAKTITENQSNLLNSAQINDSKTKSGDEFMDVSILTTQQEYENIIDTIFQNNQFTSPRRTIFKHENNVFNSTIFDNSTSQNLAEKVPLDSQSPTQIKNLDLAVKVPLDSQPPLQTQNLAGKDSQAPSQNQNLDLAIKVTLGKVILDSQGPSQNKNINLAGKVTDSSHSSPNSVDPPSQSENEIIDDDSLVTMNDDASFTDSTNNFSCNVCNLTFKKRLHLQKHMHRNHVSDSYTCTICDKKFNRQFAYAKHVETHLLSKAENLRPVIKNEESLEITNGGTARVSKNEENFIPEKKLHIRKHNMHFSDSYTCTICDEKFIRQFAYAKHVETHLLTSPIFEKKNLSIAKVSGEEKNDSAISGNNSVNIIEKNLINIDDEQSELRNNNTNSEHIGIDMQQSSVLPTYDVHMDHDYTAGKFEEAKKDDKKHLDGSKVKKFEVENAIDSAEYYILTETATSSNLAPKQIFCCKLCGLILKERKLIQKHYTQAHGYHCKVCHKKFSKQIDYLTHQQEEHIRKNFSCPCCNENFTTRIDLTRHMIIHNCNLWICECKSCNENFQGKLKLLEHIIENHGQTVGTPELRFYCPYCEKTFGIEIQLDAHIMTHLNLTFSCRYCNLEFENESKLREHLKTHDLMLCTHCDKQYYTLDELQAHVKNHKNISSKKIPEIFKEMKYFIHDSNNCKNCEKLKQLRNYIDGFENKNIMLVDDDEDQDSVTESDDVDMDIKVHDPIIEEESINKSKNAEVDENLNKGPVSMLDVPLYIHSVCSNGVKWYDEHSDIPALASAATRNGIEKSDFICSYCNQEFDKTDLFKHLSDLIDHTKSITQILKDL